MTRTAFVLVLLLAACADHEKREVAAPVVDAAPVPVPAAPPVAARRALSGEFVVVRGVDSLVEALDPVTTYVLRSDEPLDLPHDCLAAVERENDPSFTARLGWSETGRFYSLSRAGDGTPLPRLSTGEKVTVTPIGRIPGLDDFRVKREGASDVAPSVHIGR
jgi:hypothetical protein